jgi:hypothetical protein
MMTAAEEAVIAVTIRMCSRMGRTRATPRPAALMASRISSAVIGPAGPPRRQPVQWSPRQFIAGLPPPGRSGIGVHACRCGLGTGKGTGRMRRLPW